MLWASSKFGIKAKLRSFIKDLDSLWYPAQDDVVFVREDNAVLAVLNHEEKIEIWRLQAT